MDWQGGFQLRGARSDQATRPVKSHPGEGGSRPNPGENTLERTETKSNRTQPWRELEDPTLTGTPKVSSRKGTIGSDSKPTDPEEKEKPTPSRDSAEATDLNRNGVKNTSAQGRGDDHQALTYQTTLPPGRETNGKPAPGPRAILRHLPQA